MSEDTKASSRVDASPLRPGTIDGDHREQATALFGPHLGEVSFDLRIKVLPAQQSCREILPLGFLHIRKSRLQTADVRTQNFWRRVRFNLFWSFPVA